MGQFGFLMELALVQVNVRKDTREDSVFLELSQLNFIKVGHLLVSDMQEPLKPVSLLNDALAVESRFPSWVNVSVPLYFVNFIVLNFFFNSFGCDKLLHEVD